MSWLGRYKNPGAPVDTHTTRVIGTPYSPSSSAYVMHFITAQFVCTAGQTATLQLLSDSASPPTNERTKLSHNIVGTMVLQMVWETAPGDNIKLVASGTGTVTLVDVWEIPQGAPVE